MKKINVLLIISFLTMATHSQNSYPLVEENKTWNVISVALVGGNPWDTTYSTLTYEFFGDTIIDSKSYLKLYKSNEENPTTWNLWCYMREDSEQKVWYRRDSDENEILMYNFNAQQGDTLMVGLAAPFVPLIVDSIGEIEINETARIKYWLSYYDYSETWIDGIGSSKGICWSNSSTIVGGWSWLLCVSENGEQIYKNPNYETCYLITGFNDFDEFKINIYPNPTTDFLIVEKNKRVEINSISLTNLNGQIIKQFDPRDTQLNISELSSGIYFLKLSCEIGELSKKIIIE